MVRVTISSSQNGNAFFKKFCKLPTPVPPVIQQLTSPGGESHTNPIAEVAGLEGAMQSQKRTSDGRRQEIKFCQGRAMRFQTALKNGAERWVCSRRPSSHD